jgi:membrane protease YdiL (CAAX protease family)
VQFIALFLLPSLFCARLFSNNSGQYLGLKKPSKSFYWIAGATVMIIALPLVEWLGVLNQHVQFPKAIEQWMKDKENEAGKTIQSLLSRHTIKDLLLNVILIAGLAAVGEELMFRGMMQRLLIRIFKNPWIGIIVAAFIFSAFHLQFYGFLPRFMLGILLGVIYWYSGSLWASMLAHFVYDGLLIVLAYIYPEMANDDTAAAKFSNIAVVALVSLAFVMAIVTGMVKRSVTKYEEVYADDLVAVKDNPF